MSERSETPALVVKKPSLVRRLLPLIGLGLFAYILSRLDGAAMLEALSRIDGLTLALASGSFTLNLALKAVRWTRLLRAQDKPLPLSVAMAAFFGAQFYGQVTVGRVGEFFRAEALIERGASTGTALSSCVVDRIFDLLTVFALGSVLGALVVGNREVATIAAVVLGVGLLCGAALVLAIQTGRVPRIVTELMARVATFAEGRKPLRKVLTTLQDLFTHSVALFRLGTVLEAMAWTAVAWTFYFGALWALAAGMALPVTKSALSASASLAALSALLPVTVSGLGARELIYKEVLGAFGVAGEIAVVLALLHLAVMSLSAIATGLIGLWFRRRQRAQAALSVAI